MTTLFDSEEKAFIRERQWGGALYPLLDSRESVKILEFLGSRWEFWQNLRNKYPGTKITVDGVTMEENVPGADTYDMIFRGRFDQLVGSEAFAVRLPYDLINLDYCGGGRYYEDHLRYFKVPEICRTIELNLMRTDRFRLLITVDTADDIYPIRKGAPDAILNSPVAREASAFLDGISHLDTRPYWLMIIGNAFELARFCTNRGYTLQMESEPYTYIGESIGHKTRMIAYSFSCSTETPDVPGTYEAIFELAKRTYWVARGEEFYNAAERYL